jgi:hypothetical protein
MALPPARLITKDNVGSLVAAVLAGQTFTVAPGPPTGYTRQFQHQDWIDFVDPVQAGGNNGFNERFHALESEFDLIAAAIASVDNAVVAIEGGSPAVGLTIALSLSNGANIPVPSGFSAAETKFFAFVKWYAVDLAQAANTTVGFQVFASDTGVVTAATLGSNTAAQSLFATGIAIAKKGGW